MTAPSAAEALRLAREAIEDDQRATPGPWRSDGRTIWRGDWRTDGQEHSVASVNSWIPSHVAPPRGTEATLNAIAVARTREPQLARFVEAVLSAGSHPLRVGIPVPDGPIVMSEHTPRMDGKHVLAKLRAEQARALAADLLRAADLAEGRK